MNQHYSDSKRSKKGENVIKKNFINTCAAHDVEIFLEKIERIENKDEAKKSETYWICQFSAWGFRLLNKNQTNGKMYKICNKNIYGGKGKRVTGARKSHYRKKVKNKNLLKKVYLYPNAYQRKIIKMSFTNEQFKIIQKNRRTGDIQLIYIMIEGKICHEMIRLYLKRKTMKMEVYQAVKKYYRL